MLARSEDEFELFQKMDNERIMNQDPDVPPLMQESELPAFLWYVFFMSTPVLFSITNGDISRKKFKIGCNDEC